MTNISMDYTGRVSLTDQDNLNTLFDMLANKSYLSLLLNRSKLEGLHNKLKHVHPLNFFEVTKDHPSLRKNVKKLASNGDLVWQAFKSHLVRQMSYLNQQGQMKPHLNEFAKRVDLDEKQVRYYADHDNMTDFLYYAIKD